jgi:hypothetical protein
MAGGWIFDPALGRYRMSQESDYVPPAKDIAGPGSPVFSAGENRGSASDTAVPYSDSGLASNFTLGGKSIDMPANAPQAQAPAQDSELGKGATDAIGAGVQGAGQAFSSIMQAFARDQALKSGERNSDLDMSTVSRIADTKLTQNKLDFNSEMRQRGLAALLKMLEQIQNYRSAGTKLQQDATDTTTSSSTASRRKR